MAHGDENTQWYENKSWTFTCIQQHHFTFVRQREAFASPWRVMSSCTLVRWWGHRAWHHLRNTRWAFVCFTTAVRWKHAFLKSSQSEMNGCESEIIIARSDVKESFQETHLSSVIIKTGPGFKELWELALMSVSAGETQASYTLITPRPEAAGRDLTSHLHKSQILSVIHNMVWKWAGLGVRLVFLFRPILVSTGWALGCADVMVNVWSMCVCWLSLGGF